MDNISSGYESDAEPISMDMLEDITDGSQSHSIINRREESYKIHDNFKQWPVECKRALLSTQNMGKGLHKLFKAVVNDISQALPILGESGSEASYLIPEPRKCTKVTRLSEDIKKPCPKENLRGVKSLINNKTFLVIDTEKGECLTPCMDVCKSKIQSNGSLDKLGLIITVR